MIEKIGVLTFQNGILVATLDPEREFEKRGGLDQMLKASIENNALLSQLSKKTKTS